MPMQLKTISDVNAQAAMQKANRFMESLPSHKVKQFEVKEVTGMGTMVYIMYEMEDGFTSGQHDSER